MRALLITTLAGSSVAALAGGALGPAAPPAAAHAERATPVAEVVEDAATPPKAPGSLVAAPDLDRLPTVLQWKAVPRRCRRSRIRRCNGPRRVPEPVGKTEAFARALGLGTHQAAAEMIRTAPRWEWLDAAKRLGLRAPRLPLRWPVDEGRFGRGYGRGRAAGGPRHHRGIDFTAEVGTPVRAVADALVGYADNTVAGYGNLLVLIHGDGSVSSYAHLSAIHVFPGQVVRRGQQVAQAGTTGISRGPHLHFEWREGGEPRDPMDRFDRARWPEWMRRARPETD